MERTILITGASSGFGKLTASALLAEGHRVVAGVRGGAERLRSLFDADEQATGRLHGVDLHVGSPGTELEFAL